VRYFNTHGQATSGGLPMSKKPSNNLCCPNGPAGEVSTHALWALGAAVRALEEVVAAYEREEEASMFTCVICGESYWPSGRWRDDWCPDCHQNFRASDELRLHAEIEPTSLTLTPRQVQAMRRIAERHRQEDADDAPGA
jgi:hypothetical protein